MQNTSDLWKSLINTGKVEFKAVINGLEYTYADIAKATISLNLFGQSFSLGNACSATLDMTFKPAGVIPTMAKIECYVRYNDGLDTIFVVDEQGNKIQTVDGYFLTSQYPSVSEWLPFGVFYLDTRSIDRWGWMHITAYDAMLMAEVEYWDEAGQYPLAMSSAVGYICSQLGWQQDSRNTYSDYTIDYPAGVYTMREVLKFIATANGGNFIIAPDGKLRLVKITAPVGPESETQCSDVTWTSHDPIVVSRISLYPDENTMYTSGSDSGYDLTGETAYATQTMANNLLNVLNGIEYLPFSATNAIINPALELGDSVKVDGKTVVLASISYTVNAGMIANIGAPFDQEINHEYQYAEKTRSERILAQSYSQIRKTTDEIALEVAGKLNENEVNALVDVNLNELALSYRAGTNGASITLSKNGVNISGDVKLGKIDAGQIDVVNLNADNITAGQLSADYIKLGGEMEIYQSLTSNTVGGYIGYGTGASGGTGALLSSADGSYYFVAVNGSGARITGGSEYIVVQNNQIIASSAIQDGSDRRLKENIDYDISKYEALFPLLRACSFSYKQQADGRKHLGFIAQDVDDVRNSLGIPVNDLAAVGQPDEHIDYYRIAYNEFVPLLVHMLQKLYARVEKLEAKIKETETDVNG